MYVICAVCMLLVGLVGFTVPLVRDVESAVPDHDQDLSVTEDSNVNKYQ